MYCTIIYSDTFKNELEVSGSLPSIISVQTLQCNNASYVIENTKLLVNPDCPVQILLDYICSEIGIDKMWNYDLCDYESGQLIGIKTLKPWISATSVMKPLQTYIVVLYEKNEYGEYKIIQPLLNKQSMIYSEVMTRLKRQMGSLRRLSSGYKKTRRTSSITKVGSLTSYRKATKD